MEKKLEENFTDSKTFLHVRIRYDVMSLWFLLNWLDNCPLNEQLFSSYLVNIMYSITFLSIQWLIVIVVPK